jgi:L-cysteine S-thiosulfotransferase
MKLLKFAVLVSLMLVVGCATDPKSGEGFTLPDGDVAKGQATFARLQCNACHIVSGVTFDEPGQTENPLFALGGETTRVRTYGDLVTSIINPSHRFATGYKQGEAESTSPMRIYNDELTVTELTDLVAFLQSHYKVRAYQPTPYMPYY